MQFLNFNFAMDNSSNFYLKSRNLENNFIGLRTKETRLLALYKRYKSMPFEGNAAK